MHPRDDWSSIREDRTLPFWNAGIGAFTLMMVPIADKRSRDWALQDNTGLDTFKTGTVTRGETYTIRRSVLQASPASVCTIRGNGEQSGDC